MRDLLRISVWVIMINLFSGCGSNARKKETFALHLGNYVFDINRTDLNEYKNDSAIYQKLTITFKEDSSFIMNMRVPFFADSVGRWIAGDGLPYSYNQLFFNSLKYNANLEGTHFYPPYLNGEDSVFLIVGASPQNDMKLIHKIYFKKKRHLNKD